MGLNNAALILIFVLFISSPSTSLCILPSHYSFPALKSSCVDYVCSMWSLFNRSREPILITPRNLFLLVNVIVLFLLISLHLQRHAPAAGRRLSRTAKQLRLTEKLTVNDKQSAQLQNLQGSSPLRDLPGEEGAAMAKEASISAESVAEELPENLRLKESFGADAALMQESSTAEVASMQESLMMSAKTTVAEGLVKELAALETDGINGACIERIVLEEDGRLRLIVGQGGKEGTEQAEKIVLEEDGERRLIEATDGSDQAEKIVLEEDGRLRLIDGASACRVRSTKPRKSRSTGDDKYNSVDNYDQYIISHSVNDNSILDKLDDDSNSLNNDDTNYSLSLNHNVETDLNYELNNNNNNNNNSVLTIDCSLPQNLSNVDASLNKKRSSRTRTSSGRPIRVKQSDSLEATWKAISNNNKVTNTAATTHLVRQSSRQNFKPSRAGNGVLTRASHSNNTRVRREPSIGQDELNAKVESFIAKFNEQIRIQRQQSLLSYMQMVDRGA